MSQAGTFEWTDRRTRFATLAGFAANLGLTEMLIGLRTEHFVLTGLLVGLVLLSQRTFRFVLLALPLIATGISYDLFRVAIPLRGAVHIADLYATELALFGIQGQVPALWFEHHTHPALDFITGLAYLIYLYIPMGVAAAFYFIDKRRMLLIGVAFFLTNLLGMIVYLLYPAAPPWYVAAYGLGPIVNTALPNAAGAARFDALLGIEYFKTFYERSANVFGAMPSLHVAYPTSTLIALWGRSRRWTLPLALFVLLVAFAAIYLQHHYILDVLAGFACALLASGLAWRLVMGPNRTSHA